MLFLRKAKLGEEPDSHLFKTRQIEGQQTVDPVEELRFAGIILKALIDDKVGS